MVSRQRGGKSFLTLSEGESVLRPSPVSGVNSPTAVLANGAPALLPVATSVACASTGGRILTFDMAELKAQPNGGRGLTLMDLEPKDTLAGAVAYTRSVRIVGVGRGGKEREEVLEIRSLNNAKTARARKGKAADLGFKPHGVYRVE